MLKRYFYRDNDTASLTANKSQNNTAQNKESVSVEQAELVACVLEDKDTEEEVAVKDAETLPLYNFNQKETVKDVIINPELSAAQQSEIMELLDEYSEIFRHCGLQWHHAPTCQLNFPVSVGLITVMWTIMCWRMCCKMLHCRNTL